MAEKTKSTRSQPLSRQVNELANRLKKVESALQSDGQVLARRRREVSEEEKYQCALPPVPPRTFSPDVSLDRQRLLRYIDKKWTNGTKLRYCFFDDKEWGGEEEQMELVREGFTVWEDLGIGISFEEVSDISEAEIRIGFKQGKGAWSYVGRDVIDIPGQFEPTMNFGWDLTRDPRGVDTPVHEIGHTLGFPHEHQNPHAGIVWDREAVIEEFSGPPNNWPVDQIEYNILRKLTESEVEGSEWDPNSIMHYSFPPGIIKKPERYHENGLKPESGLSDQDIEEVLKFYPPQDDAKNPRLELLQSDTLSLEPAEQKNFTIEPPETREYTIQTFGQSDTVMVLFEDQDGDLKYVDGDDDSGTSQNSLIQQRLYRNRRYILRIRMYTSFGTGDTAVMMW